MRTTQIRGSADIPNSEQNAIVEVCAKTAVRWRLIAPTLLIIWIVGTLDKANLAIVQNNQSFLSELDLHGRQAQIGALSTGLLLAYGLGAPLWGWLVARIGPRQAAAISLVIWGLTCFWSGIARSYGSFLASRIVLGLGEAAIYPCSLTLVAYWFALKERGRATSYWQIGTMIGPMLVGLIVTFLISHFGWRVQFFTMGSLALILPLPMVLFLVRDDPTQHSSVDQSEAAFIKAGALEKNRDAPGRIATTDLRPWYNNFRFWLVAIASSFSSVMYWGWSTWLPTYLRTVRGFSFSVSGYLTFVIYGAAVVATIAIGHVSDKIFRRALLAALGWSFDAIFVLAAVLAPTAGWAIIFSICSLCFHMVGATCGEMMMHSVVRESQMGVSQGSKSAIQSLIGASSPFAIGLIIQATGSFIGAFSALAVGVFISAGCMLKLAAEGF